VDATWPWWVTGLVFLLTLIIGLATGRSRRAEQTKKAVNKCCDELTKINATLSARDRNGFNAACGVFRDHMKEFYSWKN
jgi:hypothetical protein